MIVGKLERHCEGVRRDAVLRERLVIAAVEEVVAVGRLMHFDAGQFARLLQRARDGGVLETGKSRIGNLRTGARIGAPNLFQIQIGHCLGERQQRMPRVVARSQPAPLFAEERQEHDAPFGMYGQGRQRLRNLDHRHGSAAIVVRSGEDFTGGATADVIVVRREQDVLAAQRGVRSS